MTVLSFSRRTFLRSNAALLAAGGLGLTFPGRAAAAGADATTPLLPSFGTATRLDAAVVSSLNGFDQLLLTTLQGVVNREEPRLYFGFDGNGDSDFRWLPTTGAKVTRHDDALSLVARYRDEVRGAILVDPDVPDSVNVATTLAGLENAVACTAEQAAEHGLRTIVDLRGKFDADNPLATYRWQFDNLFPRCTHTLLAGLPPVRTVKVDNVQWREVARETERIRDLSNRALYTFDLSPELSGADGVFLRFQDSLGDDGWGASVGSVKVTADGAEVASFVPGTEAEAPYLFDGLNSSIGDKSNRFSDGGGYFVYRFTAPAGTQQLLVEVDLWNQYLVTATTTAPTRVEPFPYFRDYAVASKAMVLWLPPAGETGALLDEVFSQVRPTTPYAGWFSNDVAGEWGGVDRASQHGVPVVPADYYMNGTVHAGVRARISDEIQPRPKATLGNKVYLTLTVGEGDNVQYCQRRMRDLWNHPDRGQVPVNWTISPLLADIGPGLLAYYQRTATENDLLIAGPSGAGYSYAGSWPEADLAAYTKLTGDFLRRTGMDLVYAYNPRNAAGNGWIPFDERVVRSYADNTQLRGIIQSWETGDLQVTHAGIPVIGNLYPQGKAAEYLEGLKRHIEGWDGSGPLFIAGAINAWNWTPGDIAELGGLLEGPFELVRGDTFFELLREAEGV